MDAMMHRLVRAANRDRDQGVPFASVVAVCNNHNVKRTTTTTTN